MNNIINNTTAIAVGVISDLPPSHGKHNIPDIK